MASGTETGFVGASMVAAGTHVRSGCLNTLADVHLMAVPAENTGMATEASVFVHRQVVGIYNLALDIRQRRGGYSSLNQGIIPGMAGKSSAAGLRDDRLPQACRPFGVRIGQIVMDVGQDRIVSVALDAGLCGMQTCQTGGGGIRLLLAIMADDTIGIR